MIPSIGRIVHFTITGGPLHGAHRAALIVDVPEDAEENSPVTLQIFAAGGGDLGALSVLKRGVVQDNDKKEPGTWHEPEGKPAAAKPTDFAKK